MKITNFLLCDDIRSETGNKLSFMGVYDNIIEFNIPSSVVKKWPQSMRLGILLKMVFEDKDLEKDISSFTLVAIRGGENVEIAGGNISQSELISKKRISMVFLYDKFAFTQPGQMTFVVSFFNGQGEQVDQVAPELTLKIHENILDAPVGQ